MAVRLSVGAGRGRIGSAALLVRRVRPPRYRTIIVAAVAWKSVEAPSAMWENPGAIGAPFSMHRQVGRTFRPTVAFEDSLTLHQEQK